MLFAMVSSAMAQTKVIYVSNNAYSETQSRYRVKGDDSNDGLSWAKPKLTIQAAINAIAETGGEVWVAAGTYYPTESVDRSQSDDQYKSFKIPAGVTVRGGFLGFEATADGRDQTKSKVIGTYYKYTTILSGDLSKASGGMTWDDSKQQYKTAFTGNSFHVVWLADIDKFTDSRAGSIASSGKVAKLEGCSVTDGNAYYISTVTRDHTAYGGGIYMTQGAVVENCYVYGCSASRNGGGIYMDGGGEVIHTAVTRCQALGIGITYGYGGGICMEGNGANTASVSRTGVSGCVGRMGGGLSVLASSAANKDALTVSASVIVNNTATTEGGGVYTDRGGVLSHLTVTRNKCNGTGVYVDGVTTGRSAGIYCRDNATIVNSVLWGGECDANSDVQYANSCRAKDIKVQMKYVALSNTSNIDWSTTTKVGVTKLSKYNSKSEAEADGTSASRGEGFPLFTSVPSTSGTHVTSVADSDGKMLNIGEYNLWLANWDPQPNSTVNNKGIDGVLSNKTTVDLREGRFTARCTLGAYSVDPAAIQPQVDGSNYNIYVDPDAEAAESADAVGDSWDNPARFLGDALDYVPTIIDELGFDPDEGQINIYIKEGTVDNTRSGYSDTDIRGCALEMPLFVNIYGGYSESLTGTDVSSRNPVLTPTIITANIDDSYSGNARRLIYAEGVEGVTIDGVQIRYANNDGSDEDGYGAAMYFSGSSVTVKNVLVAGCYATNGPAIYSSDGEVTFENCIFHNNETCRPNDAEYGIAYCEGGTLSFDHCDFLHNAGYAIVNNGGDEIKIDNSVFYANMGIRDIDDTNGKETNAQYAFAGSNFTSDYKKNLFDSKAGDIAFGLTDITTRLSYTYNNKVGTTYPLFMNSTKSAGVGTNGYYSDATYYGRTTSFQPLSLNPMVNAAYYDGSSDFGTDMSTVIYRNYGGLPDIGAIENHYADDEGESSNKDGQLAFGKVIYVRDYRNDDGSVDYTKGGDGNSWTNAINGNGYYDEYSGTYKGQYSYGEDYTGETKKVTAYTPGSTLPNNPSNGDHFMLSLTVNGTTYYIVLTPVIIEGDYRNNNCYFTVSLTTDYTQADVFRYERGNHNDDVGAIYDETRGYWVGWDGNDICPLLTYRKSEYGNDAQYQIREYKNKWEFEDGVIFTWNERAYNWYVEGFDESKIDSYASGQTIGTLVGGQNKNYTIFNIQKATITTTEVQIKSRVNYMSGLQYAVNRGSRAFDAGAWQVVDPANIEIGDLVSDDSNGANQVQVTVETLDTWRAKTSTVYYKPFQQVWVGAGTYAKDNETNATATGLFPLDTKPNIPASAYKSSSTFASRVACDESCFIIRDGVNVLGAFPREGNPGKEHRHPLVSKYVHVDGDYNPADYETFLQPVTTSLEKGKVRRVLGQALEYNIGNERYDNGFKGATWDGFTIRYGNVDAANIIESRLNGGAGVSVYQHATVKNCVVTENTQFAVNGYCSQSDGWRGGGVFVQGGTVMNCYVINNRMLAINNSKSSALPVAQSSIISISSGDCTTGGNSCYGAGIYLYNGTVYNSVIANNYIHAGSGHGAGVFMDQVVTFFNNTVVNNMTYGSYAGGIAVYSYDSPSQIRIYNSIIANNGSYSTFNSTSSGDKNIYRHNSNCNIYAYNCLLDKVNYSYTSSSDQIQHYDCQYLTSSNYTDLFQSFKEYGTDFSTWNLRLKKTSTGELAINKGQNVPEINDVDYDLSTYTDMDFNDRIQDCTIDIGAYEYNDAYGIVPAVATVDGKEVASFYVTPEGRGLATADSPANAACADKFQTVLDAAGRYKYLNPSIQVIVRVANSKTLEDAGTPFQYYARRTTDTDNDDARVYSIMVPRGVEVWGGYSDVFTSATDNGFIKNGEDQRKVLDNPTYFDSYYYNKSKEQYAYTYHVLTFTDKVFDADGTPFLTTDASKVNSGSSSYGGEIDADYLSLADQVSDRAVVDGIFITGGKANVQRTTDYNKKVNINSYGGAAIVTDFAHVRNCIVRNNEGTYGGALALAGSALVSGCLIDQNTAEYGGGIYVFENGTELSDGTTVDTSEGTGDDYAAKMPHVYTSTIVNNYASEQGGGIWFGSEQANVRVNSTIIWQNDCKDEADVSGITSPSIASVENVSALNFYPFAYSAFLNKTVAGVNNHSLKSENEDGARFATDESSNTIAKIDHTTTGFARFAGFGYYKPTNYSALLRRGMSLSSYNNLVANAGLSANDFSDASRTAGNRQYVDIGARAKNKELPNGDLMLRIYVAETNDEDNDALSTMMNCGDTYYNQEGSSFAYPMTDLQDALDYIVLQRKKAKSTEDESKHMNADKLPFEIILSRGSYTPTTGIDGMSEYNVANTYAIPEGVSIYGGFYTKNFSDGKTFYGKYFTPKAYNERTSNVLSENVVTRTGEGSTTIGGVYVLKEQPTETMLADRVGQDLNNNDILEPYELQYQSIFNGNPDNTENTGTYHIATVVPDANVVGYLPPATANSSYTAGKSAKEVGQAVVFDGITFTGGYAHGYQNKSLDANASSNFFQGGAIFVDGNRYSADLNGTVSYKSTSGITDGVGYRDIPVYIANCRFVNNQAGYGGAVATNTSTSIFNSVFAQNRASAQRTTANYTESATTESKSVEYPGVGGAVYYTGKLYAANSIFFNNEAIDEKYSDGVQKFSAFNNAQVEYMGGVGGAMFGGSYSNIYMTNCNVVKNKANKYPAFFTLNPNAASSSNEIVNTVIWGNEQNANATKSFAAGLITNYGKKDRGTAAYTFTSAAPSSLEDLDSNFGEMTWFSAYEENLGKSPVNTDNNHSKDYSLTDNLINEQNSNVTISSQNKLLEGPNFTDPSTDPGYKGYYEGAKWNPMRLSTLTDNGSGTMKQSYNSDTKTFAFGEAGGLYNAVHNANDYTMKYMPIGSDRYMVDDNTKADIYRISLDYKLSSSLSYIDIGAYEYIHTQLKYDDSEENVDVIWVAYQEKADGHDGSSWETPTTDIQSAIETLLQKRNGKRKEIRFESESKTNGGSQFAAMSADAEGNYCFTIDTKALNDAQVLDDYEKALEVQNRFVTSLTFKGGYSYENKYSSTGVYTCDVNQYPAVIRAQNRSDVGSDHCNHLFYIKDATQRYGLDDNFVDTESTIAKVFNSDNGYGWWPNAQLKGSVTTIPVEFDGLTMINAQASAGASGAAIYYADQKFDSDFNLLTGSGTAKYTATASETRLPKTEIDKPNSAKIVLSKCKVLGSGNASDKTVSAVYVGQYGGPALIFNSVFHSNYGSPLVAYDAMTVNNTFAMNAGKVELKGTSSILNSILWKNNAGSAAGTYSEQFSDATTFNHNAYTGCSSTANSNVALSADNSDVINGPNFVDPENEDIESRSFDVNPSVLIFNKGLNTNYNNTLAASADNNIYDYAISETTGLDAAGRTRIMNGNIDLGAYEFQSALARVVYVDPNSTETIFDGKSWTKNTDTKAGPMGLKQFQSAIDMAAVYNASNGGKTAFVFVKGGSSTNRSLHTGETITLRNGVQVYASVPYDYKTDCGSEEDNAIKQYVSNILAERVGIAATNASKTYVKGIATGLESYTMPTVADGLVVAPVPDQSASVTSPVINIAPADASHLALRNIIVAGFTATAGNLVNIDNALLYEALMRDNKVGSSASVLNLGSKAYAVNVTVDGTTTGADHAYNSLINFTDAQKKSFSGVNYSLDDKNLNYQLSEGSLSIDACDQTAAASNPASFLPENLKTGVFGLSNIAYSTDRDLLGNPRLLTGVSSANKIDAGAFETWRIDQTKVTTSVESAFYPHDGSVVYIMSGNNLVCGTTFTPGYLLLKDGASLYGNGNNVNVAYVSVERNNVKKAGSVVSLPYAMQYVGDVTVPSTASNGVTTLTKDNSSIYTYDASKRADWKYSFASVNSACWTAVANADVVPANQGVLYVPNANFTEGNTLRFTAKGTDATDYIYTEASDETSKTVVLAVNNDAASTNGAADFTTKEDMGWNCIGVPYLVSNYKTYDNPSSGVYFMDAPHKMWLYYDGKTASDGTTSADGDGGFYSVNSWDSDWHVESTDVARIWAGEGFFVQTARLTDDEELVFYRPVYSASGAAKHMNARILSDGQSAQEEMIADEVASDVKVYVANHKLFVKNITEGADINVYTVSGKAEITDHTENSEYSVSLTNGVHIVNVNGKSFKVYVK